MTGAVLERPLAARRPRIAPTLALRDPASAAAPGRPPGEVGRVLLAAMERLATPARAPTLGELAVAAQVGRLAAKATLANMVRAGRVRIVRRRWVAHRRSPVAEYARAAPMPAADPAALVERCLQGWAR